MLCSWYTRYLLRTVGYGVLRLFPRPGLCYVEPLKGKGEKKKKAKTHQDKAKILTIINQP